MYDKALDVFTCVADCGSFSKAADGLYLTHTAVIKQINTLEKELGVTLFHRTNRGVSLTAAGHTLYEEAEKLRTAAKEAVQRVRDAENGQTVLRIGSSPLSPCQPFLQLWSENAALWPQLRVEIIPFTDDTRRVEQVGVSFDLFIGPCDAPMLIDREKYRYFPLGSYTFHIAMPQMHRLANRKSVKLEDLLGETLCVMKPGLSPMNDAVRKKAEALGIRIENVLPNYNMQTFNRCAESGKLLLSLSCWAGIHPGLKSVPLEEELTLPYGIVAAKNVSGQIENMLAMLPAGTVQGDSRVLS